MRVQGVLVGTTPGPVLLCPAKGILFGALLGIVAKNQPLGELRRTAGPDPFEASRFHPGNASPRCDRAVSSLIETGNRSQAKSKGKP